MTPFDSTVHCQPSLVGREREWQQLMEHCLQLHQGRGGLLCLSGEAGIGKTALLKQLAAWAEKNHWRTLWGRHLDQPLAPPLHGLRQAIARLLEVELTAGAQAVALHVRTALQERWPHLRLHDRSLADWLAPAGEPGELPEYERSAPNYKRRLYHQLFCLLQAAASEQISLLFLDDLQWADPLTFEALTYLAPQLTAIPLLLITAYRPEESAPVQTPLRALARQAGVYVFSLSRLNAAAVTELVARRLEQAPAARLGPSLHRLTEGVPLFVEQYLQYYQETGGTTARELEELPLPERLSQLLARRLAPLAREQRTLLDTAAVAGEPFSAELLARASGRSRRRVLEQLAQLEEEQHLIRRPDDAAQDSGLFAFHHPLIGRWIYEALPAARGQLLHTSLANALEPLVRQRPDQVFALARHLQASQQHDRAVEALFAAGQRAFALHGHREARQYYRQALELCTPADRPHRAELEEALGDALGQDQPTRPAASACYERSLALQDDPERRGILWEKLARCKSEANWRWRCLQQGLRETEQQPQSAARYRLWLALIKCPAPDAADNRTAALQAVRLLRRRSEPWQWLELLIDHLPFVRDHRRFRLARQQQLLRRGIRLASAQEAWDWVIQGRFALAKTWRGVDLGQAIAAAESALALGERYLPPGHRIFRAFRRILFLYYLADGRHEQAASCWQRFTPDLEDLLPTAGRQFGMPEKRWEMLSQQVHEAFAGERLADHHSSFLLSHWQLLAGEQGREAELQAALASLQQQYPHILVPLLLHRQPGTEFPTPPSGEPPSLEDLDWQPASPADRLGRRDAATVELTPGPEVGLGRLRLAPCLTRRLTGDFALEVCLAADNHPQRAGGLIVRQGENFLRFGSGIDHLGQLSLSYSQGCQFRCAGIGSLPAGELYLRLVRQGRRYTARASLDRHTWYGWEALEFGQSGPVEVGLFAECNYHYCFPRPFPVRFSQFRLHPLAAYSAGRRSATLFPLPHSIPLFQDMVGQSPAFRAFCAQLEKTANSSFPVLVYGETGTGKELVVRAIHRLSRRRDGPFLPFSVAGIPAALLESELFGHLKGAFSGADRNRPGLFRLAQGGTLFMDEIGELPLELQVKLLRAISQGEILPLGGQVQTVDVRCLAATLRDLERLVALGQFRADLFYRLGQPLYLPPLRQRREDIPYLVAHFVARYAGERSAVRFTRGAMRRLLDYDWPGNVRQLEQVVERSLHYAVDALLTELELCLPGKAVELVEAVAPVSPKPDSREALMALFQECHGNLAEVSRRCGVARQTVYRWLAEFGLDARTLRFAENGTYRRK